MSVWNHAKKYLFIVLAFAAVELFSTQYAGSVQNYVQSSSGEEGEKLLFYATIGILFSIGFFVFYLAKSTPIPSFVLVIFFGFAAKDLLDPLLSDPFIINALVTIGAVFILFGGGLETPFRNFKRLFHYIFSLAFIGTLITGILLAMTISVVAGLVGFELSLPVIVLLGIALSSTDPAAIIPSFECLIFKKDRVKHIAISESALNDVIGAVITITFVGLFESGLSVDTVFGAYQALLTPDTLVLLLKTVGVGAIVGVGGFAILEFWNRFKQRMNAEEETDTAFFMMIPFLVFTASQVFGGSGFLAAFLSALLFKLNNKIKHVEHYFNSTVSAFMKPMIFITLGALIDLKDLIAYAPLGILVALIFMFVLRPLTVLITLGPFWGSKKTRLSWREMVFLSFVRETGVIPAALLVTLAGADIAGVEAMLPIGMWIILCTLLLQPPLTPALAKWLQLAETCDNAPSTMIGEGVEPTAVLVTRGGSFGRRLPIIADWAMNHNIHNVAVLFSPEEKYDTTYNQDKEHAAKGLFSTINTEFREQKRTELNFEFILEKGSLQDNIRHYTTTHDNISIIFAGKRMLDFRSKDIKELPVPFFFID
jgi:cell volume regulation protein A